MRPEPPPELGKDVGIDVGEDRAAQREPGNARRPGARLDAEAQKARIAELGQPERARVVLG